MRSIRSIVAVSMALAVVSISSCSVDQTLDMPMCDRGGEILIVAQSVPGAELIPCLEPLPAGWEVDVVRIGEDGTLVRLDSDRAGGDAAILNYTATCDVDGAVSVPSEQKGADAFERIRSLSPGFVGDRYFTFDGGCVWWQFEFDEGATAALSVELGNSLQLVTRVEFNEIMRDNFIDEDLE